MRELQPGLWHWQAPHPDWQPSAGGDDGWGPEVSCYASDDGERLLLFDPQALPAELEKLADSRDTAIVITNAWHERDARDLAERLGADVFVPPPDGPDRLQGRQYAAGDRLPGGVVAHPGSEPPFDHMLWIESRRVLIIGDSLIDNGTGLALFDRWIPDGQTREQVLERLRPLLELPIELVLPTHGEPTDRAALERALTVGAVPFTLRNIKEDLEDIGSRFDGAPDLEFRAATKALALEKSALSYQRVPPGYRFPYGHTHKKQEEVYVVLRGGGRMKVDDEIVELKEWDVVRLPPGVWRGYEAGSEGLELLVIGAPNLGDDPREDVDGRRHWWGDS